MALLGGEDIDSLRQQASDLWNSNYRNDGALTSILASSLWPDRSLNVKRGPMDTLARSYYASSCRGDMGAEEFNDLMQNWLSEQTGGLLKEQTGIIELDDETVLDLAATVYFNTR